MNDSEEQQGGTQPAGEQKPWPPPPALADPEMKRLSPAGWRPSTSGILGFFCGLILFIPAMWVTWQVMSRWMLRHFPGAIPLNIANAIMAFLILCGLSLFLRRQRAFAVGILIGGFTAVTLFSILIVLSWSGGGLVLH